MLHSLIHGILAGDSIAREMSARAKFLTANLCVIEISGPLFQNQRYSWRKPITGRETPVFSPLCEIHQGLVIAAAKERSMRNGVRARRKIISLWGVK